MIPSFDDALQLLAEEKYAAAKEAFLRLNEIAPDDARVHFGLGSILHHDDRVDEALHHLQAAAKIAKTKGVVFTKLAEVLLESDEAEEALEAARKGAALDRKSAYAQVVVARCYSKLLRVVMAKTHIENALRLDAGSTDALLELSSLEAQLGNFEKARDLIEEAYRLDPDSADVITRKLTMDSPGSESPVVTKAAEIVETEPEKVGRQDIGILSFRVASVFEKEKNIGKAFYYYEKHRDLLYDKYDNDRRRRQIDVYRQIFTKEFFESRKTAALTSEKPVFVFGMPRSGTTLTEQIIANHKLAHGVGECTYFTRLQKDYFGSRYFSKNLLTKLSSMQEKDFKRVGKGYLKTIESSNKKAIRIVDKMPHNFEMLWMPALLFPNAKFIHLNRDPADNCCSIYTSSFNRSHSYSIDQETLGEYYLLYREMMDLWRSTLPVEIYDLSYENLVEDQETETRKLIDHIGLNWDPACLEFYNSDSQVFTASQSQVRQPIYKSSRGRWKRYEEHIQPLLRSLGMLENETVS
ncbi:tetratricopeptide repeat-containing sulfotransferase family protein [Roseibium aggregatum]|uniref:Sulfotransferase n=1 Tax=Roseibium aggregatum TaxID=187304 RepID=A0A939J6D0_9HYPH|nr:sulfotransferase [Roseibium aggregatum]MBN9673602.1 sulfotransferase [Roseibium aggregatum]